MAYQKFVFNFTLIDQKVYIQIITNQFTPIQVVAHLTPFNTSKMHRFHKINLTVTFFLLILKISQQYCQS